MRWRGRVTFLRPSGEAVALSPVIDVDDELLHVDPAHDWHRTSVSHRLFVAWEALGRPVTHVGRLRPEPRVTLRVFVEAVASDD